MRWTALLLVAMALVLTPSAAHAREPWEPLDDPKTAWVLQSVTGFVTGTIGSGYSLYAAARLFNVRERTAVTLAPLPFAAFASLGIWLAGRLSGIDSSLVSTAFFALVPAAALAAFMALIDSRDFFQPLSFLLAPVLVIVTGIAGFEVSRPTSGSGGDPIVRHAVVDERMYP